MMTFLVVHSSPNRGGLTETCAAAAVAGIREAGAEAEMVRLNDLHIDKCHACGTGWGPCRTEHECQEADDFQSLHQRALDAQGLVIVTPVYWSELSESAKAFCDRLRRCEASFGEQSRLSNKPVIAIVCAGGTGNGTVTALQSLDNWIRHVRARMFDLIGVTRWSRPYKLETIRAAARAMAAEALSACPAQSS